MASRTAFFQFPISAPTDLATEWTEGNPENGYNIICQNGNVRFGLYLLPLASGYFREKIESLPIGPIVHISCRNYSKEIIKVPLQKIP